MTEGSFDDIADMPYETARDELAELVEQMQRGTMPLDLTVRLWERGEALAQHCETLLLAATERIRGEEPDETDEKEPF
ncbi:exodeoxyribonuclease VII small subunit [Stomatohabitans albus]|uniref:exodeoxyribonuclease VII small subunit n=1 Tax=Stomatohabitans albus TaxID=3110766 RepID=UPI00300C6FBC